ncbi:MAG TPA: lysylphosphatidylglycerol synthase transmembrane domain-containing protein [Chitinophagaceae bacterium]|nr:lysylphosphatidylglycerol synthase transmembrane domain-containing protein [Chitinophagaceae bacterium]HNF71176.1 lysylphosphatidylglycerol synthase transmembrane domain-containing protein [Chitinophagaceae bacterium]
MSKRVLNLVTWLLTFGLCGLLIWLSVKDITDADIEKIRYSLKYARYYLLIPIIAMGLLSHWSRAVRWKYLMEPMGLQPKTRNAFFAVLIGYLANLGLPRFGEVVKCTLLARYEKIPADKLIGTIITERAFDVVCLLLIFAITFLVQAGLAADYLQDLFHRFQSNEHSGQSWIMLGSILGIFLLIFLFRKKIASTLLFKKLQAMVRNIVEGVMSFRQMKRKKEFLFHTLFIWSLYLGMIVLGFKSIPETSVLGFKAGFSVLSFGSIGMIVTPGGMGAYTLLVNEIVSLYGIGKAMSIAISWIIWLVPTLIIIAGGIVALILLPLLHNKKQYGQ